MTDLDLRIRAGLQEAASTIADPTAADVAALLRDDTAAPDHRPRRLGWAVAAGVVVLAALAAALAWPSDPPIEGVRTATTTTSAPRPASSFEAFGPGWHEIDPGPVPPMSEASLAWSGTELVVGGATSDGPQIWAYRPALVAGPEAGSGSPWRQLAGFPYDDVNGLGLVWARGKLLAVEGSFPAARAAVYDPGDGRWQAIDHPPASAALVAVGQGLRNADRAAPALVWTGSRVLDLTHGSAWNPRTGSWTTIAMPDDLLGFTSLANANPVWTGSEVVASSWSTSPGLAWNADGSAVHEVPAPSSIGSQVDSGVVGDAVATRYGSGLLLASATEEGWAAVREGDRPWRSIAPVPGMTTPEGCPRGATSIGGWPVVIPCDDSPPVWFDGSQWRSTGTVPIELGCCMARWLGAGRGLVVWQTDRDLLNGRREAYREAAVWVSGP